MDRTPKPYYPGFRDMNLALAFGLTFLFFVVIWLVVLTARVVGLRRRIEGFDRALAAANVRLDELNGKVISEAAFANAPIQAGDPEALERLLRASAQEEYVKQADVLSELGRAVRRIESQRNQALLEYEQMLSHPVAARLAAWLAKPQP